MRVAVHYLKAVVNVRIKGENDVRDYVDDVVLQEEADSPEATVSGLKLGVSQVRDRFGGIGQVLNDAKEQVFVPTMATMRSWIKMNPGYCGKVGKSVKDLGVGFSAVGVRSPDTGTELTELLESVAGSGLSLWALWPRRLSSRLLPRVWPCMGWLWTLS